MPFPTRGKPNLPGHQYVVLETDDDDNAGPAEGQVDEPKRCASGMEAIPRDLDDPDDEHLEPSELELKTLRRISGHIPWQAYSIAFVELCERFSWYGTTAVCE